MFRLYGYDINVDLREPGPEEKMPIVHELYDGQQFDLGGGRIVTAYDCPGHSAGEMVFLDEQTHTLFAGDAVNYNLGASAIPVETTLRYLKRLQSMSDRYDGIWNGHHDFRALGMPLEEDCLPNIIALCEEILAGHYSVAEVPSFWGQPLPLSATPRPNDAPPMMEGAPAAPMKRVTVRKGRNFFAFDPDLIYDKA
jgi:glyoxylase-like metal-dependent hydrolase (beta-lactamase superfamily II)